MSSRQRLQRAEIADMAARIISDEGLRDYHAAKLKAAQRLGYATRAAALPGNVEVEKALREYQLVFVDNQAELLQILRREAIQAMEFLEPFSPRLVGSVLDGTADQFSAVCLHLFSDTTEEVAIFLHNNNVPYDLAERRFKRANRTFENVPSVTFAAGDVALDLSLFYTDDIRQAPLSPIDGKPMRRASIAEVKRLADVSEVRPA